MRSPVVSWYQRALQRNHSRQDTSIGQSTRNHQDRNPARGSPPTLHFTEAYGTATCFLKCPVDLPIVVYFASDHTQVEWSCGIWIDAIAVSNKHWCGIDPATSIILVLQPERSTTGSNTPMRNTKGNEELVWSFRTCKVCKCRGKRR